AKDRRGRCTERQTNLGDVAAAIGPERCRAVLELAEKAGALAIEEALHMGQKGHELTVVTFLQFAFRADLVLDELPETARRDVLHHLVMALDGAVALRGHELQRPEHHMAEMSDHRHRRTRSGGEDANSGIGYFVHRSSPWPASQILFLRAAEPDIAL